MAVARRGTLGIGAGDDRTLHLATLAEKIAQDADATIVGQADLGRAPRPYAISSTNGLDALREITGQSARRSGTTLAVVVRDDQIRWLEGRGRGRGGSPCGRLRTWSRSRSSR
jgi:hypothetical protein